MTKKTLTIKKEVFLAKDGTEFSDGDACAKYEASLDREAEYEAAEVRLAAIEIPFERKAVPPLVPLGLFIRENGDLGRIKRMVRQKAEWEKRWRCFMLSCREDVSALAVVMAYDDHCGAVTPQEIVKKFGKTKLPCVGLYAGDYKYGREIGTFKKEMELVRKYCRLHGYDITLKKWDAAEESTLQGK